MRYLSLGGIATYTGLAKGTIDSYSSRGYLPDPDAVICDGDTVLHCGWLPKTIDHWLANRPGRGARTDLKSNK